MWKTLQDRGLGFSSGSIAGGDRGKEGCGWENIYVINQSNATRGLHMNPYSDHQLFFIKDNGRKSNE